MLHYQPLSDHEVVRNTPLSYITHYHLFIIYASHISAISVSHTYISRFPAMLKYWYTHRYRDTALMMINIRTALNHQSPSWMFCCDISDVPFAWLCIVSGLLLYVQIFCCILLCFLMHWLERFYGFLPLIMKTQQKPYNIIDWLNKDTTRTPEYANI